MTWEPILLEQLCPRTTCRQNLMPALTSKVVTWGWKGPKFHTNLSAMYVLDNRKKIWICYNFYVVTASLHNQCLVIPNILPFYVPYIMYTVSFSYKMGNWRGQCTKPVVLVLDNSDSTVAYMASASLQYQWWALRSASMYFSVLYMTL